MPYSLSPATGAPAFAQERAVDHWYKEAARTRLQDRLCHWAKNNYVSKRRHKTSNQLLKTVSASIFARKMARACARNIGIRGPLSERSSRIPFERKTVFLVRQPLMQTHRPILPYCSPTEALWKCLRRGHYFAMAHRPRWCFVNLVSTLFQKTIPRTSGVYRSARSNRRAWLVGRTKGAFSVIRNCNSATVKGLKDIDRTSDDARLDIEELRPPN